MATSNKTKDKKVEAPSSPYFKPETVRWAIGVILIIVGVFASFSVLSYYFNWKGDYDILRRVGSENPNYDPHVGNSLGPVGAWLGELFVGRTFGLLGLIIPIYMVVIGVSVAKEKKHPFFNKVTLSVLLVLILGSLTLGAIFGDGWNLFNSGVGGAFGVEISGQLKEIIKGMGVAIMLVGLWIFTGVFININFINTVNRAGGAALSGGEKIVDRFKNGYEHYRAKAKSAESSQQELEEEDEMLDEEPQDEEPKEEEPKEQPTPQPEPTPTPEENPFLEFLTPQEELCPEPVTTPEPPAFEFVIAAEPETRGSATGGLVVAVEANDLEMLDANDIDNELYDPLRDLNSYTTPDAEVLVDYHSDFKVNDEEIFDNKSRIEETLKNFGIPIQKIKATVGPTITLYEIVQAQGVKISKIQGLENDIAQSLKALGIRIIAPIPGKGTIGIEVPNRHKQIVSMRSSVLSAAFQDMKAELPIVIGRTIQNESYVFDLAKMPHLLVAGATGQGKSVGLNAIITSLLYKKHPAQLKFVMIDPKMVEFSPYRRLEKHFMAKMESEEDVIITDPKKAVYTLNALCDEMEHRLKLLSKAGVRNIVEYNDKFTKRRLNPQKGHFFMPYIVVIIDEFADLIMIAKEVETPVMRIAQKARAIGIHLIVATQRPDVKVITGGIKANFPARIAFRVTQMIDSRTIIDQPGANQLIGRGDMLFSKDGELTRIQCALVETDEVERIVDSISAQQGYPEPYRLPDYSPDSGSDGDSGGESGAVVKYDPLFADIARAAVANGSISTSAIQRNYEVGFNRAGRIMTQLERAGIVGRQEGAKPRDILYYDMAALEAKLQELGC